MDQLSLGTDRTVGGPADGAPTELAAACWAAGELLARSPGPISRLRVRFGEVSVEMQWPTAPAASPAPAATAASQAPPATAADRLEPASAYVRAPMVGTFYHAPSPDAPPFIKVGDVVEAGQQVGIVEAMKLMNEVEADQAGRVTEIVVDNGAAVEFDQPLFAIVPLGSDRQPDEG